MVHLDLEKDCSSFWFFIKKGDNLHCYIGVDMKVGQTAALDKRGLICVWRAGQ